MCQAHTYNEEVRSKLPGRPVEMGMENHLLEKKRKRLLSSLPLWKAFTVLFFYDFPTAGTSFQSRITISFMDWKGEGSTGTWGNGKGKFGQTLMIVLFDH